MISYLCTQSRGGSFNSAIKRFSEVIKDLELKGLIIVRYPNT